LAHDSDNAVLEGTRNYCCRIVSVDDADLGRQSFSSSLAAPSPTDTDSNNDEDDGDDDAAERDDDLDPLVERRLVAHDDAVRHQRRRLVVPRRLELEETVGRAGRAACCHSQYVPRRRMNTHTVHRLYTHVSK